MRPTPTALLLCGMLILAGCGIKGNLYLPEVPQLDPEPAAETSTAPSQDGDDSKPAATERT
jgi:predicted small lipoprotein YifL